MLIRFAEAGDVPAWAALATEVSAVFQHPADMGRDRAFLGYIRRKIGGYEALVAVDYRSGACMGFIGFSRTHNRVSWFAVAEAYRGKGAGGRLLKTALRQLDHTRPVSVATFPAGYAPGEAARALYRRYGFAETEMFTADGLERARMVRAPSGERRGGSFHYRYPAFMREADPAHCPVCNRLPQPGGQEDITELAYTWATAEYPGQGRLFGKLYVMPKAHVSHFDDMPEAEMAGFMGEVQRVGRALRAVTGAVKINYEMHANSGTHLHIHLFPRYLDDEFPGAPIDYRVCEPPPYEDYGEFRWFVDCMRRELGVIS